MSLVTSCSLPDSVKLPGPCQQEKRMLTGGGGDGGAGIDDDYDDDDIDIKYYEIKPGQSYNIVPLGKDQPRE